MPRNSSGTMSAPGSYPPVADTIISLDDYKALVQDVLDEITDSLSRSGDGGMLAALKLTDGTLSLPGLSFNSEASTGFYRYGAGDLRLAILGALVAKFTAAGLDVTGALTASGAITSSAGISGTTGTFSAGLANDASHGARGGGTQHADATGSVAGFMPAADKTKLDAATSNATADALVRRDGAARARFATPSDAADAATKGYVDGLIPGQERTVAAGRVSGAGALSSAFGATVVRNSAGNYTVTLTTNYSDIIPTISMFQAAQAGGLRITAITFSPTTFTVQGWDTGGNADDVGFTFKVTRGV